MKIFRRVLKKDFSRLGVPFALWLLLLGFNSALSLVHKEPGMDMGMNMRNPFFVVASICGAVIYGVLHVYLAASVVLEDPPKGTSAFWLTRPLPRGPVVAAKACFLAILAVVPALANCAIMVALGAGGRVVALTGLEGVLYRACIPFLVAAFTVTAESFGQAAINAILILIGTGVVAFTTQMLLTRHGTPGHPRVIGPHSATLTTSTTLAFTTLAFLAGLGIVLWRYLRRHTRLAVAVVSACSLGLMLTPHFWNWDFLQQWKARSGRNLIHESDIQFVARPGRAGLDGAPPVSAIAASFDAAGNVIVPRSLSEVEFDWPDGEPSRLGSIETLPVLPIARYAPGALARVLAPVTIVNLPRKGAVPLNLPFLLPQVRQRLTQGPATLRAHVYATLRRYEVAGELPLRAGARKSWGFYDVKLTGVLPAEAGVTVSLREAYSSSALAGPLNSEENSAVDDAASGAAEDNQSVATVATAFGRGLRLGSIYLLVNRARREAFLTAHVVSEGSLNSDSYTVRERQLDFTDDAINPAWLAQAVLLRIRFTEVGQAEGSVAVPDFALAARPGAIP